MKCIYTSLSRCVRQTGVYISKLDDLDLGRGEKFFLNISLLQDDLVRLLKGTFFHELVKKSRLLRIFFNSTTAFTKKMRGDKKSC